MRVRKMNTSTPVHHHPSSFQNSKESSSSHLESTSFSQLDGGKDEFIRRLWTKVKSGFSALRGSPNELWKAYTLKFLDSYAYFSFSVIFTLFLSADFGFTDVQAGTIYGAWGALVTIFGLLTGFVIDNLGVARSLRLGFALSLLARCVIFATTSSAILLLSIALLSFGNCLGIPVLTTGIRRYTTESNRGFAFALFYVIMNVAALLSGPVVDLCTIVYKNGTASEPSEPGIWSLSSYRLVVLSGIFANVIACLVAHTVREIKVVEQAVQQQEEDDERGDAVQSPQHTREFQPVRGSAWDILRETMNSSDFWRFLAVCLITLNVRMIFRHLDATLPKYMVREFGEDTPKGTIYSINPALIIILVPIITAATTKVDPLLMIHHGSYISAASVFFLVASTSIGSCVLFVVVLSVGEAIWSPRLYDYTMSVCREGREGTYMALSSAPLFLAKLPVGFMSGYLLQKYCPEEGDRNSQMMWLIIGLTTATSPILLTVFWKYVSKRSRDEHEAYTELQGINEYRQNPAVE